MNNFNDDVESDATVPALSFSATASAETIPLNFSQAKHAERWAGPGAPIAEVITFLMIAAGDHEHEQGIESGEVM
jgi:hypothetical protein